jgi:ATP-dependent exoDNAse (exonuclease V) alpha subunit
MCTKGNILCVGGYAFTDHKAQGQTLPYAVIDIAPTPQFTITPFAAYVALSRSRGRQTIRLLRDFDDKIFTMHPSSDLRAEDARLIQLAELQKTQPINMKWDIIIMNSIVRMYQSL